MRAVCYVLVIFACLLLAAPGMAGSLTRHTFESQTLNRDYAYTVYLPDHYLVSGMRYPVVYLLHGSTGSEMSWPNSGKIKSTVDRLIAQGEINPLIIVMPGHNESWWADGNDEPAQTALLEDLFPYVENTYRTLERREGRAVAGLSAGGFGTVSLVLQFPEMFAAAAALSPAVYTPAPPSHSSANRHKVFQTEGELDPQLWESLNWPAFIDDYKAQSLTVPLYINSGDHDTFDIAYHAAVFYQAMREHQPEEVEYRVVDGNHQWSIWRNTIGDALQFIDGHLSGPR